MSKNTGKGYRIGTIPNRSQYHNPVTGMNMKRDTTDGQFMSGRKDVPYKNVRRE